ncbi:MAG: helix-turn-helix domain-containing protein [Betaproteobacteria bacterium]|nr:helix-turn-helix domain-containing protein [Betaproteobacteria bacterium]
MSIPNDHPIMRDRADRLDNDRAAEYLGVAPGTLEVWRCTRRYPIPYMKVGRKVYYDRADLDAWLASRRIQPAEL